MKKFIFAAYTFVLIAMFPALFIAYLNDGKPVAAPSSATIELERYVPNNAEATNYHQDLIFVLKAI